MRKFFLNIAVLIFLGLLVYIYQDKLRVWFRPLLVGFEYRFLEKPPCSKPIAYDVGTFDRRFNISHEYFLSALADAEAIWEKPSGLNLFEHTLPLDEFSDILKINLEIESSPTN